jgi:type II secretory pathway pseudopilin PulG
MRHVPVQGLAAIAMLGVCSVTTAQDWRGILEEQIKQRANRVTEQAIDKGLDAAEDAVRCVVTDRTCIDNARSSGSDVVLTNKKGKPLPPDRQLPAAQAANEPPPAGASTSGHRAAATDRFTSIIASAPESTVVNGYVVNNRRVAVQKELEARPPTHDELGVALPNGARLEFERTARQIAQYHPYWRIYEYSLEMPKADLLRFFTDQGLTVDQSMHRLHFSKPAGNGEDFIDNLQGDPVEGFRIWRIPPGSSGTRGQP